MIKFLHKLLGVKPPTKLATHDPADRSLSSSSTPWTHEQYCDVCLATVTHDEAMTDICLTCGSSSKNWPGNFFSNNRARRMIFDGNQWLYQYSYRHKNDIVLSNKKL